MTLLAHQENSHKSETLPRRCSSCSRPALGSFSFRLQLGSVLSLSGSGVSGAPATPFAERFPALSTKVVSTLLPQTEAGKEARNLELMGRLRQVPRDPWYRVREGNCSLLIGDSNLAVGTKLNWMHKRKNFIKLVILPLTGSVDEEMVTIGRFVSDQGSFLIKYAPFA